MNDNGRAACRKLCLRSFLAWGFTIDESGRLAATTGDDALRVLSQIVLNLDGLYDDDAAVRQWMKTPRPELGENTPAAELLSGVAGIHRVHSLTRLEANR